MDSLFLSLAPIAVTAVGLHNSPKPYAFVGEILCYGVSSIWALLSVGLLLMEEICKPGNDNGNNDPDPICTFIFGSSNINKCSSVDMWADIALVLVVPGGFYGLGCFFLALQEKADKAKVAVVEEPTQEELNEKKLD